MRGVWVCGYTYGGKNIANSKFVLIAIAFSAFSLYCDERWDVGNVDFRGNEAISQRELIANMGTTPPRFLFRQKFDFNRLDHDISTLKKLYKSRGYPFIAITIYTLERDTATMTVNITLTIAEGPLVMVDSLIIEGADFFDRQQIHSFLSVVPQTPLDSPGVHEDGRAIRDSIRAKGYLQAAVKSRHSLDRKARTATITHTITEGPLVFTGEITLNGYHRVLPEVIRREVTIETDSILSSSKIRETLRQIYSTALFQTVHITPDTSRQTAQRCSVKVNVTIHIKESPFSSAQAGFGYDTGERFYVSLVAAYRNLLRRGHRVSLLGRASSRLRNVQLTYSWPWLFSIPVWADFSLYAERRAEPDFEGDFEGALAAFRGDATSNFMYSIWTRIERTQWTVQPPPEQLFPLLPISANHVIAAALTFDTREERIPPPLSTLFFIQTEIAGLTGFGNQYIRLQFDSRFFLPVRDQRFTLSCAFFTGYAFAYGADISVPPRERFRTGENALRDVRGYVLDEVTPLEEGQFLRGGDFAVVINVAEAGYSITQGFQAALFIDAGNVWSSIGEFNLGTINWSVGIGVRVALPIGITRLDLGVPFYPQVLLPGRFHLALGFPF